MARERPCNLITIYAGSWRWGFHEDDHGTPADGMARYQTRFGTPEPPPGVAIFEDVLVNEWAM